jgi:hypothetical protein
MSGTESPNNTMTKSVSVRRKNIGEVSSTEGTTDGQRERRNYDADRSIDENVLRQGRSDIWNVTKSFEFFLGKDETERRGNFENLWAVYLWMYTVQLIL